MVWVCVAQDRLNKRTPNKLLTCLASRTDSVMPLSSSSPCARRRTLWTLSTANGCFMVTCSGSVVLATRLHGCIFCTVRTGACCQDVWCGAGKLQGIFASVLVGIENLKETRAAQPNMAVWLFFLLNFLTSHPEHLSSDRLFTFKLVDATGTTVELTYVTFVGRGLSAPNRSYPVWDPKQLHANSRNLLQLSNISLLN